MTGIWMARLVLVLLGVAIIWKGLRFTKASHEKGDTDMPSDGTLAGSLFGLLANALLRVLPWRVAQAVWVVIGLLFFAAALAVRGE